MKNRFDQELVPGTFVAYGPCSGGITIAFFEGYEERLQNVYDYPTRTHQMKMVQYPIFSILVSRRYYPVPGSYKDAINKYHKRRLDYMYAYRAFPISEDLVPPEYRMLKS
jgi:hypothetical protein